MSLSAVAAVFSNLLWKGFRTVPGEKNANAAYHANRLEVLQCILATISRALYVPYAETEPVKRLNPYLLFFTSNRNPTLREMFFSFINFGLNYRENGMVMHITS
jgi:hypothetical protein